MSGAAGASDAVAAAGVRLPRRLIGVVGAPGVGKSTYAEAEAARTGGVVLPMDGFHLPQAELVRLGRRERMGAPDSFDVDGFVAVLTALRADDGEVLAPGFDRDVEEAVPGAVRIPATARTVIVEGNYLLLDDAGSRGGALGNWGRVALLLDEVRFLELPEEVRLERLIARHIRFGKSPEDARAWALGPDEANARLVAASRARASSVIHVP